MENDLLTLFAVLVSVVVAVQVLITGLTTVWMHRHIDVRAEGRDKALDAKIEGIARTLDAKVEGIGRTLDARIASVEQAVATGAEEHRAWRVELDRTNKRLDDEFANTNKRLDDEFANTNKRLDGLLLHLMGRDNAK